MKNYIDVVVPKKTIRELVSITCDLCGAVANDGNWASSPWQVEEVEIHQRDGVITSDGGHGVERRIDLCPGCFRDRLIPWLEAQGGRVNTKDWDW